MGNFKIKNLTNELGKRDVNYNQQIKFEVKNGLFMKQVVIEPGQETYLSVKMLPIKLQSYRIKGLASVIEISNSEYASKLNIYNKSKLPTIAVEPTPTKEVEANVTTDDVIDEQIQDDITVKPKKLKNN